MRSVTLQSYWTQVAPAAARHTISVVKSVTGDAVRRQVVDATKCANCHEWFEGHGGNRVIGKETGSNGELVCVVCHVPGLPTSGHSMPDTAWDARTTAAVGTSAGWSSAQTKMFGEWGVSLTDPLKAVQPNMPRVTNNFKEMIHGIHAGRERVTPFADARYRSNNLTLLDFRRMDFPGVLSNCEGCHKAGTYSSVPGNALVSVFESKNAAYVATPSAANAAASLASANADDVVQTPFGGACAACHDSSSAKAHMGQNGSKLNVSRTSVGVVAESCQVCHGPNAEWDAAKVHK